MTKRDRIVVIVLASVVGLAGFWFGVLKPKRAEVASLDTQVAEQTQRRDAALQRVAAGEKARETFKADYATVARLGKAVPATDQTPSLVYGIESTADAHGVDFRALKLAAAGGSSATGSSGASAGSSAAGTQAAAAVAPPGSTVGPAGFPTLPFAFKFDGGFHSMERFLSAIERYTTTTGSGTAVNVRGRLFTIDGIAIKASRKGFPQIEANLAATAYVLPPEEGLTGGATPQGPGTAPAGSAAGGTTPAEPQGKAPTTTATVRGVTP